MAPQDFLQEYVEEVREHLQDLERALLTLEQEGAHKGEIQQIFRVAHSIKGASAYMGFERLAGLTHELESLISQIQAEARPVTSKGVSALLSCVDFISNAVGIIAETREEPDLPDSLLEELRAFLAADGESVPGAAPEADREHPGPLFETGIDLVDVDPLLEAGVESLFEPADSSEPPVEFHRTEDVRTEVDEEEDRELYSIFLQSFAEHFAEMGRPFSTSSGQNLSDTEISRLRVALERLIASSLYMNYETVAAELRKLEDATLPHGEPWDRKILLQEYEALAERLRKLLPGLELQPAGAVPEETGGAADVSVEDDEELLAIYSESFRETFLDLACRCAVAPDALLAESEVRTLQMLVERLASSSRYMDFGEAVNALNKFSLTITEALRNGGVTGEILAIGLASCRERLCRLLPAAALPETAAAREAASVRHAAPLEDDDQELLTIFMDSFQELYSELVKLASGAGKSSLSEDDFARLGVLMERMIASSRYMDYEPVTRALQDFEQSVRTLFEPGLVRGDILLDLARSTWEKLREILPSLRFPDIELLEAPGEIPSLDSGMPVDRAFELTDVDIFEEIAKPVSVTAKVETKSPIAPKPPREDKPAPLAPPTTEEPPGETSGSQARDGKQARKAHNTGDETSSSASLRVDALKVDQLLNQVGELVVSRSEFIQTAALFRDILRDLATEGRIPKSELKRLRALSFRLNESTQSLGRVANDLQESVMRVRMLPISQLFHRFPRVVRDQSLKLGKKVDLVVEGGETEIDKRVLELMQDPIIQLIRNAIAHGIESPEERKRLGKPETGAIRMAAWHQGDDVVIEIEDDGCGVDIGTLREILKERRELSENEIARLTDSELMYAIFLPGVSTRSRVDGTAGRGVGLDVVKEKVERMNGSVEVDSMAGIGTRFTVRIPLTVAIIRALLVRSEKQVFTIPLSSISEILQYRFRETHTIEGFQVVSLRGKTIPLVHLGQLFGIGADQQQESQKFTVVVSTSFREVGLVVDGLIGEREVVIKPLEDDYHAFDGFSGATILGDGAVSLILDVSALLKRMKGPHRSVEASQPAYVH
ncbi:MAG: chemotaxis protein CheW [Syntrophobacteraceae bacterium]